MTTIQEYLRQIIDRAIPEDGVIREDHTFVVDEVSVRHIIVSSVAYPELKIALELRRPAEIPFALTRTLTALASRTSSSSLVPKTLNNVTSLI